MPYGPSQWRHVQSSQRKLSLALDDRHVVCCETAFRSNSSGSGTSYLSAARTHTRHSSLQVSSFPSGEVHGWSRNGKRAVRSAQARTRTGCRVHSGRWGTNPGGMAPRHPAVFRRNESSCCTSPHNLRNTICQSRCSAGYEMRGIHGTFPPLPKFMPVFTKTRQWPRTNYVYTKSEETPLLFRPRSVHLLLPRSCLPSPLSVQTCTHIPTNTIRTLHTTHSSSLHNWAPSSNTKSSSRTA